MAGGQVVDAGRFATTPKQSFVAYRFNSQVSSDFVARLRESALQPPFDGRIRFITGVAPTGVDWAAEIRKRIEQCTLMTIADITGLRGEVLFELGIAFGFERWIMPVTEALDDVRRAPAWLRWLNIGTYDTSGYRDLLANIQEYLANRRRFRPQRLDRPVPRKVAILNLVAGIEREVSRIELVATNASLRIEKLPRITDTNYRQAFALASTASLLIVGVDGTIDTDPIAHFLLGIAASRSIAGTKSAPLNRRVIIVRPDGAIAVPEGVSNTPAIFTISEPDGTAIDAAREFVAAYSAWIPSTDQ
jgi:hypothetical protein